MRKFKYIAALLIGILVSFFSVFTFVQAGTTICPIFSGCTGTSTLPGYGKILIGGKNGEYEYVASSTFEGATSQVSSVFGRTGAITAQSGDYTTSLIPEGSNLYYTAARALTDFITNLAATTSISSITTLPNISLPYSQLTGTPDLSGYLTGITADAPLSGAGTSASHLTISQAGNSTNGYLSSGDWASFNARLSTTTLGLFDRGIFFSTTSAAYWFSTNSTSDLTEGSNLYYTNARADARVVAGIAATSSVKSITALPSLSLAYSQLTGAPDLTQYLTLSGWYGTTTDQLQEGTSNLYFTNSRADTRFVNDLAGTSSVKSITTLPSLSLAYSQLTGTPTIPSKTSDLTNDSGFVTSSFSTTSAAYWLTTKSTTDLAEGNNLYFTNARADARVVAGLAATSSINSITTLNNLSLPYAQLTSVPAFDTFAYPFPSAATSTKLALNGGLSTTYASTTGVSGNFICIGADCRTSWGGGGTVTSVDMTVPTSLSVSGNPITGSGTLALTLAAGYVIPLTASTTNWNTAYDSWNANHTNWDTAYTNRITSANYPLSISSNILSIVATSSEKCTVSCFASSVVSQWTNDAGYLTASSLGGPFYTFFHATTTDALAEGSSNLYFTNGRADGRFITDLAATSSVNSITTLANLSLPVSQLTGTLGVAHGGTGSTTLSGILKGNGTSQVKTAVANTDYQAPITLTTTGSSGAATFDGTTLNIPQYSGGATFGYPFPGNATSTLLNFTGGIALNNSEPLYLNGPSDANWQIQMDSSNNVDFYMSGAPGGRYFQFLDHDHPTNTIFKVEGLTGNTMVGGTLLVEGASTTFNGNATTTGSFYAATASSTKLFGAGLSSCNSASNALTWNNGTFGCNSISATGGAGNWFTPANWGGLAVAATTSPLFPAGLIVGTSTVGGLTATSSITNTAVTSALVLDSSTGLEGAYGGTICTNQFVRSLSATGAATCATVANADLANSSITLNGVAISLGNSATISTTTLLGDTNTLTGPDLFKGGVVINNASTTIVGNATTTGTMYAGIASTTALYVQGAASIISSAISTFYNGLKVLSELVIPVTTNTTVANTGDIAINSTVASSSVEFNNGSTYSLYPDGFGGLPFASSTLAYLGAYGAAGTTTILMANPPRKTTLENMFCKTDSGTATVQIGTGSASSTVVCTTSGVNSTTNVTFGQYANVFIGIGDITGAPNLVTVSPQIMQNE